MPPAPAAGHKQPQSLGTPPVQVPGLEGIPGATLGPAELGQENVPVEQVRGRAAGSLLPGSAVGVPNNPPPPSEFRVPTLRRGADGAVLPTLPSPQPANPGEAMIKDPITGEMIPVVTKEMTQKKKDEPGKKKFNSKALDGFMKAKTGAKQSTCARGPGRLTSRGLRGPCDPVARRTRGATSAPRIHRREIFVLDALAASPIRQDHRAGKSAMEGRISLQPRVRELALKPDVPVDDRDLLPPNRRANSIMATPALGRDMDGRTTFEDRGEEDVDGVDLPGVEERSRGRGPRPSTSRLVAPRRPRSSSNGRDRGPGRPLEAEDLAAERFQRRDALGRGAVGDRDQDGDLAGGRGPGAASAGGEPPSPGSDATRSEAGGPGGQPGIVGQRGADPDDDRVHPAPELVDAARATAGRRSIGCRPRPWRSCRRASSPTWP